MHSTSLQQLPPHPPSWEHALIQSRRVCPLPFQKMMSMEYVQTLLFPASTGRAPALPQTSEPPLNTQTFLYQGHKAARSIKKKEKKKKKCHFLKRGGRLSGKDRQKKRHVGDAHRCAACLCQQKGFKYSAMNMRILCEVSDNKGPTASVLMTPESLHLKARRPFFFSPFRQKKMKKNSWFLVPKKQTTER